MSGVKQVVALIDKDGNYIDTLNPLATTGGGGGGGAVTQGVGSGVPTSPWSVRISNGAAFLDPLTDAQLRASAVSVSLASLPLPTGAATETTLATAAASLTSIDGKLVTPLPVSVTSLPLPSGAATETTLAGVATLANQTNGTQRTKVTDGTNNAVVSNTAPVGTEYGLGVRPIVTRASTSSVTSPAVTTAFASILAANSSAKLRIFYNPTPAPVGLTLGGTGAVTPSFLLAPGQTWVMPQGPDGFAVWPGVVNGTVAVGTASIIVTEIT